MINFSERSNNKELLDADNIPTIDMHRNLQELNIINTYLGGHAITLKGFIKIYNNSKITKSKITIAEYACGGGDNLMVLVDYCKKNNIDADFVGIDIKLDCINFATKKFKNFNNVSFVQADIYKHYIKYDIIFSSLFTHHLDKQSLLKYYKAVTENSNYGWFVNDLHRHFLAYYSIKFITYLFSKSYLVKNDAPLSVLRGFKKNELLSLKASQTNIVWCWAFRWLITFVH